MAVDEKFLTNNVAFPQHIKMMGGAQILNLLPAFIALGDTDTFSELVENSLFFDELGVGRKAAGQRTYFKSEAEINTLIVDAVNAAKSDYFFDPINESAPTKAGGIKAGDKFVISADGTWDGQDLKKGDTLIAPADLVDPASYNDFIFNAAITGLQTVADATTAFSGLVTLIEAIRTDGSADHSTVTTERAVADALANLEASLQAVIQSVQTTLQTAIDTNASQISINGTGIADNAAAITNLQLAGVAQDEVIDELSNEIDDLKANDVGQDGRLDALEEWTFQGVNVPLGDGVNDTVLVPIPNNVVFKDTEDVVLTCKVSDGAGGYRPLAVFPAEVITEAGVQKIKASFAYAAPAGQFMVRAKGLAKVA